MKFAILGAGATGGYLGACLARAGLDVTLIARGRHLEAMRKRGVRVLEADGSSFTARPACTDRLEAIAAVDTVFITLKAHSLPGIAPALGAAARADAVLVFAQNGVPWWFFPASWTERAASGCAPSRRRWRRPGSRPRAVADAAGNLAEADRRRQFEPGQRADPSHPLPS